MIDTKKQNQIIDDYNIENSYRERQLTPDDTKRAKTLFRRLMKENVNKGKDEKLQESLMTEILQGLTNNETDAEIFTPLSDNKHMVFYDNFAYMGAAEDIAKALKKAGLSTDILQGVSKGSEKSARDLLQKEGVLIDVQWGQNEEGYYVITSIDITKTDDDGNTVTLYSWDLYKGKGKISVSEWKTKENKEQKAKTTLKSRTIVTPEFSYTESMYITSKGNKKTRKQYVKDTIINGKKVGGQFFE